MQKTRKTQQLMAVMIQLTFQSLLISSLAFSYKHRNQNTFVCFDFQNSTTPKYEEISLQPTEVTGTLQPLSPYRNHPAFADFLGSTQQLAVQIFLTSVLGVGKPATDGRPGCLWLQEPISSHATGTDSVLLCTPGPAFKTEKGENPLGLHMHGSYAVSLKKHICAPCESCGCAQSLRDQSKDLLALASRESGAG